MPSIANPPIDPALRARLERRGARRIRAGWVDLEDFADELAGEGLEVVPYQVDVEAFHRYVRASGYPSMSYWDSGRRRAAAEKYLEHYVSFDLLALAPSDVVIDVASCTSPWPTIAHWRYGCRVYRQDLSYPPGIEDDRIGGDAAEMPVPDGFADKLVLHCSLEHFEGDSDIGFLREVERVLKPGGRLCILPLYLSRTYAIQTDPTAWGEHEPLFDPEADVHIAERWGEVHGRFYDRRRFVERIVRNLGGLRARLVRIENAAEIDPGCYLRLALLITKPRTAADDSAGDEPPAVVPAAHPAGAADELDRIHRSYAVEAAGLRSDLERERGLLRALQETHNEQIARLQEILASEQARHEATIATIVQGLETDHQAYETEIRRLNAAMASDRDTYEEVVQRLTTAREADHAAFQAEQARLQGLLDRRAERQAAAAEALAEEVEQLGLRIERLAAALGDAQTALEHERTALSAAREELEAIHRSKMWHLWTTYHAVRRALARPFRWLRRRSEDGD